ncbi:response regulator [Novosphingobium kaempferiae]|uniref:response regulator n=1 Tax=Novosphingobium kaempferiae TaxID=2896849 RepID=UPI001E605225|nr:response regulator [Novosphingobium kaempferiae]
MPHRPIRILAVDDIRENLVALEAALDQTGVELVTASSGFEALELLLRQDFALALLDVQMPDMDGFELAELMRGAERTRGVPIIFLTAIATDERRKFRGFEAGAVDYLLKPIDITVLNSKVAVFVELARQRREIAFQRDELGAALGRLRAHGDNSPLAVLEIDSNLRIVGWYRSAERTLGYTAAEVLGVPLAEAPFLPPNGGRAAFLAGMGELLQGGDRRAMQEHRYRRADGVLREGEWYCSSLAGTGPIQSGGRPGSVMVEMLDITERRRAEDTQRLLIGELNHRVKNTLATVQAIASQGFRHARSHKEFQDAFTGRLQALSRAHSMLSATTWESAGLRRLIADHVAIGAVSEDRLLLDGPDVDLPPELALRFSLVFHELATNAHKYGALSNAFGTVSLVWTCMGDVLAMEWTERGGPVVAPPERRGFGSTLIEHSMAADGARIVSDFAPEGVRWSMTLPLSPIEAAPVEPSVRPPAPKPAPAAALPPMRILVVEDEPLVAMEIIAQIEDGGGIAIGPATSCEHALALIRDADPDLALLDGNLNGERIDRVADALAARETPFAFLSGYDREHLPQDHAERPMLNKPFVAADVRAMLLQLAETVRIPVR